MSLLPTTNQTPATVKERCDILRVNIKDICGTLAALRANVASSAVKEGENRSEVMANITIAFRALEDAAMRIGKAIQADQGGESPLGGPSSMK